MLFFQLFTHLEKRGGKQKRNHAVFQLFRQPEEKERERDTPKKKKNTEPPQQREGDREGEREGERDREREACCLQCMFLLGGPWYLQTGQNGS